MTIVHRNSLILRRDARAIREIAAHFRNHAAKGVTVPMRAEVLLELAETLESMSTELARLQEAVCHLESEAAAAWVSKGER